MTTNKIVFMGTADFSLKALEALSQRFGISAISCVYTKAPKPSGRSYKIQKSMVHQFAERNNIAVHTPATLRTHEQLEIFRALKPDVAVVSSYGLIIPQNILDIPKYGFINIHASILPRWRGAAPIQAAIMAGDKQTGVTIMKMDAGVDTGDIISVQSLDVEPRTIHGVLSEQMGDLGATMIVDTLDNIEERIANARKQPEDGVTHTQKISKDLCRINWNDSNEKILRRIMAFSPAPAAWSEIDGVRVKILDANIVQSFNGGPSAVTPGKIATEKMIVTCGSGAVQLLKIQPAGKNPMSGEDFLRGRADFVGKIFT